MVAPKENEAGETSVLCRADKLKYGSLLSLLREVSGEEAANAGGTWVMSPCVPDCHPLGKRKPPSTIAMMIIEMRKTRGMRIRNLLSFVSYSQSRILLNMEKTARSAYQWSVSTCRRDDLLFQGKCFLP